MHICITSKDKRERDVYMFHYTQWPDHGVPEPLSLVVFHRHVMKTAAEHPMGYIVVNCRYFVTTFLCHLYTFLHNCCIVNMSNKNEPALKQCRCRENGNLYSIRCPV